uniref:ribosomal protein S6 n=1 Tax=Dixoniella grisea TaxID=35153 RepID=UPI001FCD8DF2|nr:ribosomal protein S6 [Dixoniella grisea]UNJ17059.1 ribosomal protein S6 [Dixoniella grisea]
MIQVVQPDLSEEKILELINKYYKLLIENGAKNILIQNRGRRHLMYVIKQFHDGIFLQINYEANGTLTNLILKSVKFDSFVIRSMCKSYL